MKGLLALILAFLALPTPELRAQKPVPLVTLAELEKRLANGGDTTFVVNLWATWCAPCVAEMPYFEQLQQTYASDPLRVVFVSLDALKDREAVAAFAERKGLKNEVCVLNERDEQYFISAISEAWSGAIPATLFVNAHRGIRLFQEQKFNYQQLENSYLSIVQQKESDHESN